MIVNFHFLPAHKLDLGVICVMVMHTSVILEEPGYHSDLQASNRRVCDFEDSNYRFCKPHKAILEL